MSLWIIADTHWGHESGQTIRPADQAERLLRAWTDRVRPDDLVFHLGDVFFGKRVSLYQARVAQLPGRITLIKGNHDKPKWIKDLPWTLQDGPYLLRPDLCLTHRPQDLPRGFTAGTVVHGHIHGNPYPASVKALTPWVRFINASCEMTGLGPVLLEDLLLGRTGGTPDTQGYWSCEA